MEAQEAIVRKGTKGSLVAMVVGVGRGAVLARAAAAVSIIVAVQKAIGGGNGMESLVAVMVRAGRGAVPAEAASVVVSRMRETWDMIGGTSGVEPLLAVLVAAGHSATQVEAAAVKAAEVMVMVVISMAGMKMAADSSGGSKNGHV